MIIGGLWADVTGAPCNVPPFAGQKLPPNIFIIMDNSGSMSLNAYDEKYYDQNKRYYGYFDPEGTYQYQGGKWVKVSGAPNYSDKWPGNLLNFAVMSRLSVLKKVLVGGKAESRQGNVHTLVCESHASWTKYARIGNKTYTIKVSAGTPSTITISNTPVSSYKNRVDVDANFTRGVLQKLGDKDNDNRWDDDAPRFWLIQFNLDEGGKVVNYYRQNDPVSSLVSAIENTKASTWTPLAEALYETVRYFQQVSPYYYPNDFNRGGQWDPLDIWCRKSFVLLLTDGESTQDLNVPIGDYDGDGCDPRNPRCGPYETNGSHYLDDVALWMHTTDLRSDFSYTQNLTLYGVFVFGHGHGLLQEACKDGGFIDLNGNNRPDLQREWDANGDGLADTYYQAENGEDIERSIMAAILDIMRRATSATAASVISQTQRGEGTLYQAFFQPIYISPSGNTLNWIGELAAYFVDKNGNLREDTDQNERLNDTDFVIKFRIDPATNEVKAQRWVAVNDMPFQLYDEKDIWDLNHLWRAGKVLLNKEPSQRNIKAILPSWQLVDFTTANRPKLAPHLNLSGSVSYIDSFINYIRGADYVGNPNWRSRTYQGNNVWKLGDIVYSTPTFVGKPMERYDLIYDDITYREYYNRYKDRRNIVLVGANDGMLHAFNAGVFDTLQRRVDGRGKTLGDELWAIIPYNLLPHLRWLKEPDYGQCHVYYVDLKPKVTDVKIFNNDAVHPNGWGTIAIVGMRLGGSPTTSVGSELTYRSSYFAIDITNPENPVVLWEFTDEYLGYTISYPSVLKVVQDSIEKWFVVFGSGTNTYPSGYTSTQMARFYVLDLKTGQLLKRFDIPKPTPQTQGAFCGNPISVDVKLDYSVDVIYLPTTYVESQGNSLVEKGALYRIVTNNKTDPNQWNLSMVFRLDVPLTSGAAASMDEYGNLWVFFGSGKYLSEADKGDTRTNYFIGLRDAYWNGGWTSQTDPSYGFTDLLNATNVKVKIDTSGNATVENIPGMSNLSFEAFVDSVNRKYKGWYVELPNGEKSLNFPLVLGGAVFFTTYKTVSDPCAIGGQGWLYVLYYKTGTAHSIASLGTNLQGYAITKVQVEGMPASPAVQIGSREEATAFVQTSTGVVYKLDTELPFSPKSGARIWRPANF
jgi:type IV pilus assembly protein PilY1